MNPTEYNLRNMVIGDFGREVPIASFKHACEFKHPKIGYNEDQCPLCVLLHLKST